MHLAIPIDYGFAWPHDAIVVVLTYIVSMLVLYPIGRKLGMGITKPHSTTMASLADWGARGIFGVAFGEELLFRGLIFGFFLHIMPLWPAILLSSLVFGASHYAHWGMPTSIVAGILGIFLAYSYWITGTMVVPILIHGLVVMARSTVLGRLSGTPRSSQGHT